MLETRFPRIPGDIGNPATFPFPVLMRVVPGASPARAVAADPRPLRDAFVDAGRALVAEGADGITTSCGFLAPLQRDLAAAFSVPVASSALMQVTSVNALLPPGRRAAILTISAERLGAAHLAAAGVPEGTPVGGTEGGREFTRAILSDAADLDVAAARADVVAAARALVADHAGIGALVLECTNMTPYAADIRAATGLPVFTMLSFLTWFHAGLAPAPFRERRAGGPA